MQAVINKPAFVLVKSLNDSAEHAINLEHVVEVEQHAEGVGIIHTTTGESIVVDEQTRYALIVFLRSLSYCVNVVGWLEQRQKEAR